MAKKEQKVPFKERFMWWSMVLGAVFCLASAVPVLPWRYARVDTNVGNRFVMERYYSLMGASNNVGKTESWLSLRMKMKRKTEEFGRPSPLTALVGTIAGGLGTGGAATGCPMWQVCKEHVNERFMRYGAVAYTGIACIVLIVLGVIFAVASIVYLGFEQADYGKKKKKKKKGDEDCCDPPQKTMAFAMLAFLLTFGSITGFVCLLGMTLQGFKRTAYYPFAASHAGPFCGWAGCFFIFMGMTVACQRGMKLCQSKAPANGEDWGGAGGYYDAPPGTYPPYPPPAGYGPPGGKGW